MDLILWRHAEAEESWPDLGRALTARGHKDAAKVAKWLRQHLPSKFTVIASPAERTRQTALALDEHFKTVNALAPGASVPTILKAAGWPDHDGAVVVVGHQPDLGQVAAYLVTGEERDWSIKKGALWWITSRHRHGGEQVVVTAALSPDLL